MKRYKTSQKWECIVDEVDDLLVYCTMYDITDKTNEREYAEIWLSKFETNQRPLLEEGRVFYWVIVSQETEHGYKSISKFHIRNYEVMTEEKLADIKARARDLFEKVFSDKTK